MADVRRLRYGGMDVEIRPVGRPRIEGDLLVHGFRVTFSIPGFSWSTRLTVSYEDFEEPVVERIAAWNAISTLHAAWKDPREFVEAETKDAKPGPQMKRRLREAEDVVDAAARFGERLDVAWGESLVEGGRLSEMVERMGPREWLPGEEM